MGLGCGIWGLGARQAWHCPVPGSSVQINGSEVPDLVIGVLESRRRKAQVQDFRFLVTGFGIRVSGSGIRDPGFGFWDLGLWIQV